MTLPTLERDNDHERNAKSVTSKVRTVSAAIDALNIELTAQRDVQDENGCLSSVNSFDNAIARLDKIKAQMTDVSIELVAAFYYRNQQL